MNNRMGYLTHGQNYYFLIHNFNKICLECISFNPCPAYLWENGGKRQEIQVEGDFRTS